MSDPRRWLEEKDAPAGLGELIESARLDEPRPEQLEKLRASLTLLIGPPGGGGGGGSSAPPDGGALGGGGGAAGTAGGGGLGAAAATGVVGKTVAIAVSTLVIAGLGGSLLLRSEPMDTPVDPDPVVVVAPAAQVADEPVPEPSPDPVLPAQPPPVVRATPRPTTPAPARSPSPSPSPEVGSRQAPPAPAPAPAAEDELDLLQAAMSAAQSGRSADALTAVDQHVRRFPSSPMAQEREAIAIEALVKLGRAAEAKDRTDRFRAAWPTSTHLLRLESLSP